MRSWTSWWGGSATSRRGWWTARTRSGSAGWWSDSSSSGSRRMGWDPVAGETDQERLRRAALLRAVAGVARARSVLAETAPRVDRVLNGQRTALDPNLVDTAVAVTARDGDAELFD